MTTQEERMSAVDAEWGVNPQLEAEAQREALPMVQPAQPIQTVQPVQALSTFDDMWRWACTFAQTDLVPANFKNRPHDVMIVLSWADTVKISRFEALQGVYSIKGRVVVGIDLLKAVAFAHPEFEDFSAEIHGVGDDAVAVCTVKRRGRKSVTRTFSVQDAKTAKLWMKHGQKGDPTPWVLYPQRMLLTRAISWAIRDTFTDALHGVYPAEEMEGVELSKLPDLSLEASPDYGYRKSIESLVNSLKEVHRDMAMAWLGKHGFSIYTAPVEMLQTLETRCKTKLNEAKALSRDVHSKMMLNINQHGEPEVPRISIHKVAYFFDPKHDKAKYDFALTLPMDRLHIILEYLTRKKVMHPEYPSPTAEELAADDGVISLGPQIDKDVHDLSLEKQAELAELQKEIEEGQAAKESLMESNKEGRAATVATIKSQDGDLNVIQAARMKALSARAKKAAKRNGVVYEDELRKLLADAKAKEESLLSETEKEHLMSSLRQLNPKAKAELAEILGFDDFTQIVNHGQAEEARRILSKRAYLNKPTPPALESTHSETYGT